MNNNISTTNLKFLGIPDMPSSIDYLPNGSIYAAILDSVPAHLSVIIQAIKANISAGNTCVLVTQMTPGIFLVRAEAAGIDFVEDIAQSRLYLFSLAGDYVTNIFRHGIKRFLREFDYFQVPRGSFFLFDQAGDIFTMGDPNIAQAQVRDYRDWMISTGNTALFLFWVASSGSLLQSIVSGFNGVARINQRKTGIEFLVDFWYSQDGAIAAKSFPVSLDTSGLIRVDLSLARAASERNRADPNTDDHNHVFYLGPDFDAFTASIHHVGVWSQAQNFVDLIHLARDASSATIVISPCSNADLQQTAKIVHLLRLNRGNRLRIVIRESSYSLRYLHELLLLRVGANLIIHQPLANQQLQLLWEMLAGQVYTRKIEPNFDLAYSCMLTSNYKGYVDLMTFCSESLRMLEKGDMLDIPFTLIVASYREHAFSPEMLDQLTIRNGDFFSSSATHCYIFIHACAEENSAAVLSHITGNQQASLFLAIRFITVKADIQEMLKFMLQSGNIALAPDFNGVIALPSLANKYVEADTTVTANPPPLLYSRKLKSNTVLMHRLPPQSSFTESVRWPQE